MRRTLCTGLLIFAAVAVAVAQDRPDFSGTWILASPNPAPSNAPQTLIVSATFRRESVRGNPINPQLVTLSVDPGSGNLVRPGIYFVGTMGGVGGGLPANGLPANGPQTSSRHSTRWEGDKLVADLAYYTDGKPTSEHGEVWSFAAQGLLSVVVTDRVVGDASTTTNLTYRRQQ